MKKAINISKLVLFFVVIGGFLIFALTFPYQLYSIGKNDIILNSDKYNDLLKNRFLSQVSSKVLADNEDNEVLNEYVVNYKLFNLFNILSLKVKVSDNSVYLGGDCLGFSLKTKGLLIVGSNYVFTKNGAINPFLNTGLEVGDVIKSINNKEIDGIDELNDILKHSDGETLKLSVFRNGKTMEFNITPQKDIFSGEYKLGLWIKNNTEGVGTLTFVEDETLRFGSLGHAIYSSNTNLPMQINSGEIYDCNVVGLKKGMDGAPGEIMGAFSKNNPLGNIDKNCNYGVYGYLNETAELLKEKQLIGVGGRTSVKPGKAQIFSSLDGENIVSYDIEIIKANYQSNSNEKSIVFRVVDKDLLNKTGGIIQGMSGSPIVQNNKIIGAVTHVFVNDPTKGFGIYLDWMLLE